MPLCVLANPGAVAKLANPGGAAKAGARAASCIRCFGGFPMLTMLGSRRRLCDGLTRRETLKAGALSLLGGAFNLPALLWAEENRGARVRPGKAKSVILLYLLGGAPTQDMFDLKPNAPDKIRGQFKPIASNVSGIQVCELLPRMAR